MTDATAPTRRTVYRVLIVVTVAMVCARILAAERVYEPSIYRADPTPDLAAIVLPLAGSNAWSEAALQAAALKSWQAIDPNAPTRRWPRTRPLPTRMFSSNDISRWALVRALVDEGSFVIGRREYDASGKYHDTGIIFEDGWQTLDKVLDPKTKFYYSSKPPLLPVIAAGEYWLLQRLVGWRIERDTGNVIATILLTINALPLVFYLAVLASLLERYGCTDWGRLFTFAAGCFATYLTTFANTFNNHTVAAYTAMFAVAPILLDRRTTAAYAVAGLFAGLTACFELPAASFLVMLGLVALAGDWRRTFLAFVPAAFIPIAAQTAINYAEVHDWKPVYEKIDTEWYRYEGSYWNQPPGDRRGIDFAGDHESRPTYAFHLLLGHHGLFSLTPIWLLSFAGMAATLLMVRQAGSTWWRLQGATAIVSIVVIVFFAAIVSTVNYGGWTSGPRWFFWLTPLWLLALVPAADWLALTLGGRMLALTLFGFSVFSAWYPGINPWRHPWIYQAMVAWGWKGY